MDRRGVIGYWNLLGYLEIGDNNNGDYLIKILGKGFE